MLTIISLILVTIAILVVVAIIVKKFPALAILDVNNMTSEKEAKFKATIMKARVDRDLAKLSGFFGRIFLKMGSWFSKTIQSSQNNLKKLKMSYKADEKLPVTEKEKRIKELLRSSEELVKAEEFEKAEDKLLEAISLDQKNIWAFFDLGGVYEELKKYPEARQTYEYALKLSRQQTRSGDGEGPSLNTQEIYFALAWLEKDAGNFAAAFDNVQEALEFEPSSPRYLDLILDLSIIRKDKTSAMKYFERLAESNPENNKLAEIREEIMALEEPSNNE